jgi:lipid II:glycine glycyltransferase (peptidoglycan interpeptide bridge formation enzyme)
MKIPIEWNSSISIYASELFLSNVSDEYGWLGGIDKSGKILCVLPYSVIQKAVLRMIRFPVQTFFPEGDIGAEEEKTFLNSAVNYFLSTGADVIIPATFNTVFRTYPEGALVAPYGSYILDLLQSEESLWNNLHSKHRNVIRSATKKGVVILEGPEHIETAFRLVQDSFKRSAKGTTGRLRIGFRLDYDSFKRQVQNFGENVLVLVAEHEGIAQGCAVIPFSKHSAYYMHGGSLPTPVTGAMNLLQWEAIRLFHQLGVRQYDFFGARIDPERGSKVEGIMKFKERFGGQFIQGYMWKFPLRAFKYQLYSFAALVRNGGDVVDQEKHKLYKNS